MRSSSSVSVVRSARALARAGVGAALVAFVVASVGACDRSAPSQPAPSASSAPAKLETAGSTIRASGSSALQPLVNAAKERYETAHKGASVEVSAGGSKKGLADVASGAVQIGCSDIFAPDDLKAQLVEHKVAVVGFAAMANKGPFNAKVSAVSLADLAKVFRGAITDWKQLGGDPQPIVVINRAPGSGTRAVFGGVVLGGDTFVESQTEDNSGALVAKLAQTKGAISYLALSFKTDDLVTLSLERDGRDGGGVIEPTVENITSGAYPIWSYEHLFTKGEPDPATRDFIAYMLSSEFQTGVLPKVKGFIPVTAMRVERDHDG